MPIINVRNYSPDAATISAYRENLQTALDQNTLTADVRVLPGSRGRQFVQDARNVTRFVRACVTGRVFTPAVPHAREPESRAACATNIGMRLEKAGLPTGDVSTELGVDVGQLDHHGAIAMENRFIKLHKYERRYLLRYQGQFDTTTDCRNYAYALMDHYRRDVLQKRGLPQSNGDIESALRKLVMVAFGSEMRANNAQPPRGESIANALDLAVQIELRFATALSPQAFESARASLRQDFPHYEKEWPNLVRNAGVKCMSRAQALQFPDQIGRVMQKVEKLYASNPGPVANAWLAMLSEMKADMRQDYTQSSDGQMALQQFLRLIDKPTAEQRDDITQKMKTALLGAVNDYEGYAEFCRGIEAVTGVDVGKLDETKAMLLEKLRAPITPPRGQSWPEGFDRWKTVANIEQFATFIDQYVEHRKAISIDDKEWDVELSSNVRDHLDRFAAFVSDAVAEYAGPLDGTNFYQLLSPNARSLEESRSATVGGVVNWSVKLVRKIREAQPDAAPGVFDTLLEKIRQAGTLAWQVYGKAESNYPADSMRRADAYLSNLSIPAEAYESDGKMMEYKGILVNASHVFQQLADLLPPDMVTYPQRAQAALSEARAVRRQEQSLSPGEFADRFMSTWDPTKISHQEFNDDGTLWYDYPKTFGLGCEPDPGDEHALRCASEVCGRILMRLKNDRPANLERLVGDVRVQLEMVKMAVDPD